MTASQISFDSEDPYLPMRARVHGAITAYLAYFGSEIFGETHFGYRFFSIVSVVAFVAFIGLFAKYLFGNLAALFSTLFVALNEFHIVVSATAIQMSHYLLLQCAAIYFLVRAILENRPKFFYLVAAFSALGFLLYELGALMLPFALGAVALSGAWGMLRPKYLAGPISLGLVIASPDIAANLFERDADQLGWGHFAQGLGGLDFTAAFLSFFGREPFDFLFQAVLGRNFHLEGREYAAMNGAFGLAVFLSILAALRVGTSTVEDRKIPIFSSVLSWPCWSASVLSAPAKGISTGSLDGWPSRSYHLRCWWVTRPKSDFWALQLQYAWPLPRS
ncbi:glycosyltransferase family 39 protein [Ruegeria sp. HKCCA4008]|uniref:glycosyltransferase family 39 protein n=1 Tax=Ruegeria sp. HKCCA4008 TaxID=2682999 RepID=UPI001C2BFA94